MFRKWILPAVVLTPLANAAYADDAKQIAEALADKWMKSYNSHSPEEIAALFTNEAPFIGPPGVLKGRASIEKAMAARFKAGWTTETIKINEAHMIGDAVWAVGEFQFSGSGEQAGKQQSGHFGEVLAKDGADWHFVMLLATPSAAPPPRRNDVASRRCFRVLFSSPDVMAKEKSPPASGPPTGGAGRCVTLGPEQTWERLPSH